MKVEVGLDFVPGQEQTCSPVVGGGIITSGITRRLVVRIQFYAVVSLSKTIHLNWPA